MENPTVRPGSQSQTPEWYQAENVSKEVVWGGGRRVVPLPLGEP
jgi:hypothetical protein